MAKSPIRWAGGKGKLLSKIIPLFPSNYERYIECFAGGASIFFKLAPKNAILIDLNQELINFYTVLRDNPEELTLFMSNHVNTEEHYYKIREMDKVETFHTLSPVERAARFLYLNKTCFNGLYRVNKSGQFNVPYGNRSGVTLIDEDVLSECSNTLQGTQLIHGSFEILPAIASSNDCVFCDPPYDVLTKTSFTSYAETFGRARQVDLKETLDCLQKNGVRWIMSNASTEFIHELYKDYNINIITAPRFINSNGEGRKEVNEVVVYNFKDENQSGMVDLFGP